MGAYLKWLVLLSSIIGTFNSAYAVGTLAGSTISNQATLNFQVSGVAQVPVLSNLSSFVVDRVVNLSFIKNDATYVSGIPNQTNRVASFTLTNLGNGTQDFSIAVAQQATGAIDAFGGNDNTNLLSATIRVDVNANGTFETATDTRTFVDELAPDSSVVVFVLGRFPLTAINGQIAGINVTARARVGGVVGTQGATLTQATGADIAGTEQILFADGVGTGTGDIARDSQIAAKSAYKVVTAVISSVVSSVLISDPISGATNPKRIVGALIEFSNSVSNTGSANAATLIITNTVPTNMTYVSGSLVVDGVIEDDNTTGTDETDPNGGRYTAASRQVRGDISALNMGQTKVIKFRATIN